MRWGLKLCLWHVEENRQQRMKFAKEHIQMIELRLLKRLRTAPNEWQSVDIDAQALTNRLELNYRH